MPRPPGDEDVIRGYLLAGKLPPDIDPASKAGLAYLERISAIEQTRALKAASPPMSQDRVERVVAILRGGS